MYKCTVYLQNILLLSVHIDFCVHIWFLHNNKCVCLIFSLKICGWDLSLKTNFVSILFHRKENTFDMMGEDSLVLARLVYTLGVILYAAINTPVSHYPKKADVKIETLSLFVY